MLYFETIDPPTLELLKALQTQPAFSKLRLVGGTSLALQTKKDFIDLFFLLKEYSLKDMLSFYDNKYPDGSEFLVLKSLTYFNDAEEDESPIMLIQQNWETVKERIKAVVRQYLS